jgi:peptidoglycan hydrolase CwlO-like protein
MFNFVEVKIEIDQLDQDLTKLETQLGYLESQYKQQLAVIDQIKQKHSETASEINLKTKQLNAKTKQYNEQVRIHNKAISNN